MSDGDGLAALWVYLAADPLAALAATLLAWLAGLKAHTAARGSPLVNPVLVAVVILAGLLLAAGISYAEYFAGAQFVHFLLGPATVALAVPLYRHWSLVRSSTLAILFSMLVGSAFAVAAALALGVAFGAPMAVLASLAPKSVTTPVAMGIAERIGGLPSLTAVVVILSGIAGATLGTVTLNLARVRDWRARGLAMGTAAHGIGTARALSVNETAGAFSGLAMALNALATALALPLLWRLFASG
ncbi:LrgB family protein [Elioraea tepida]|jgi:predicted murein hydrolase (TIGR00659 family)|uniref:LrgB family protein n=1 Tax=Elioraea tepida TaxID=2843330 RepID=A0A975YJ65_9PROT|nr:LrgB family protein [Elioraea tepida]QXM24281.1 LrgB family protein [Elioraea tepida]